MTRFLVLPSALCFLLTTSVTLTQSAPQTKEDFVAAVIEFTAALPGTYGDEGNRIVWAIDAMETGLVQWDARVWVHETVISSKVGAAEPQVVADMRTLLGAVYLERGRIDDALRELVAASELASSRGDIHVFQALAYDMAGKRADAAAALHRASKLDPEDPVTLYLLAQRLLKIGQSEDAARAFANFQAVQRRRLADDPRSAGPSPPFVRATLLEEDPASDPFFPPAAYAEGFALFNQAKYEQAIAHFRKAAASDPLNVDTVVSSDKMTQGIAALRQGKLTAALDHLMAAVELVPDSSEAHRILGTAYWFDYQYERSLEQLEAAIRLNPHDERSRIALADVLVESGQLANAEQALRDTIKTIPNSGLAHYKLGRLYQTLRRDDAAVRELEAAIALGPVAGASRLNATIGRLYLTQTDFDSATGAHLRRIFADPNDAEAHAALGDSYRQQGRFEDALTEFLATLLINRSSSDAWAAIGQIHLDAGRHNEAANAARRALALNPEHRQARYALATSLIRLRKLEEGKQELRVFQRLQAEAQEKEQRAYDLNQLRLEAALHTEEDKHDLAATLWQKVVQLEPNLSSNYVNLARALTRLGRHDEALEHLKTAVTLDPPARVYRELADGYAKLGRLDEHQQARAAYEQLREEELRKRVTSQPTQGVR